MEQSFQAIMKWLKPLLKDIYIEGKQKLIYWWKKCVLKNGDYIEM